jgi:hypothetical protein
VSGVVRNVALESKAIFHISFFISHLALQFLSLGVTPIHPGRSALSGLGDGK